MTFISWKKKEGDFASQFEYENEKIPKNDNSINNENIANDNITLRLTKLVYPFPCYVEAGPKLSVVIY
jgi:hypothetical protein